MVQAVRNVLVYGAGEGGRQIANALFRLTSNVGFFDDDTNLQNKRINGIKVFAPIHIGKILKAHQYKKFINCRNASIGEEGIADEVAAANRCLSEWSLEGGYFLRTSRLTN